MNSSSAPLRGDRRLDDEANDRLGFKNAAANIARALSNHENTDGFVVGLEGKWGSGKSSLLYLIERETERLPDEVRPTVIRFSPWLIGNRDGLLTYLFSELSKGIAQLERREGNGARLTAHRAKQAGESLRKFAAGIGEVGGLIELAGDASSFSSVKLLGKGVGLLRKFKKKDPQLENIKEELTGSLRKLGHRFIVTIDDVDRLEPNEVAEVLRLTRSVADFPNVTYVLCYDSDVLGQSIKRSTKVRDGKAFLEKIVQLTVMVPKPEPFQLRHWFSDEVARLSSVDGDVRERLRTVIDFEGGRQLQTPRAVVKALDSLRLAWSALAHAKVDLADLVWLLLIKDGNPRLYRWLESYCGTASALSLGIASVEEGEKQDALRDLLRCVPNGHFTDMTYRHYFADQLPGFDLNYDKDGSFEIFRKVDQRDRDRAILNRRLASPDHYRLYFALSLPSHALAQADYDQFWQASTAGPAELSDLLRDWHAQLVNGNLSKADVLMERLQAFEPDTLDAFKAMNILAAFSQGLDDLFEIRPFGSFEFNTIWDRAEILIKPLLSRLDDTQRASVISNMFGQGRAVSWLTSVVRRETFAHGAYGDRPKQEREWYFNAVEFETIGAKMLGRYRSMSLPEILSAPKPLALLFAWQQLGDEDGPRDLIANGTKSEIELVEVLEALTTEGNSSSRGTYSVLSHDNVAPFLDFAKAAQRMERLSKQNDELGIRAAKLSMAFKEAKDAP